MTANRVEKIEEILHKWWGENTNDFYKSAIPLILKWHKNEVVRELEKVKKYSVPNLTYKDKLQHRISELKKEGGG